MFVLVRPDGVYDRNITGWILREHCVIHEEFDTAPQPGDIRLAAYDEKDVASRKEDG